MSKIITLQGAAERAVDIHYEVDVLQPPVGVGGMGRVMRGVRVDERTGSRLPVAVKFLYDGLPPHVVERARREASIHIVCENLVMMYGMVTIEVLDAEGCAHIHHHVVSELLRGVMLHDVLQGRTADPDGVPVAYAEQLFRLSQTNPCRFAVEVVRRLLTGVTALHDHGYIHRDLDPSNVMVTADGTLKIIDFGIALPARTAAFPANAKALPAETEVLSTEAPAQSTETFSASPGGFVGKAEYAAPELADCNVARQNATTDVYALGILLFELATGHRPFSGPLADVLHQQRTAPLPLADVESPALREVIARATAKDQAQRFQTAPELRVALDRASRSTSFAQL